VALSPTPTTSNCAVTGTIVIGGRAWNRRDRMCGRGRQECFISRLARNDSYENKVDLLAVEVVAGTGDGEAVGVFDLGPRTKEMSGTSWRSIAKRTREGD
jgi:hypothetical protein